jgi:putative FmdB family regulatory protein
MPIYEYKCLECQSHFEKMQKVAEEPLKVCEKCGGELEKQWSRSGFQFKGSGWYVTDYSDKGKSDKGKSETKSESKTDAAKGEPAKSSEKSSPAESTVKSESASNSTKSDASSSKKE